MTIQKQIVSFALCLSLSFCPTMLMAKDTKQKEASRHHSSSSSSSSDSHHSHSDECHTCKPPIKICHVPFTITEDGKYCVNRDLCYDGCEVAITVLASNVNLNFNNHNLTLSNPNATGILIACQSEVFIENDAITYVTRSNVSGSAAIKIVNSEKVSLDNLLIHNAFDGVYAQNSSDIKITKTRWTQCFDSDFFTSNCKSVLVDDCTSANDYEDFASAGMIFRDNTQGVFLKNLNFYNTDIFARTGRDAVFENLNLLIDDPNYIYGALQVGTPNDETPWEQAVIRNSTFNVLQGARTSTAAGVVELPRVVGALVEDCVMEGNTGGQEGNPAIILSVGSNAPGLGQFSDSHNVRIVNCVIQNQGSSNFAISIDATNEAPNTGIVVDNCTIAGATDANVIVAHTQSSVVKNSNITDGMNSGVFFGEGALACSAIGNTISNNCGAAVALDSNAENNVVKDNTVFNNGDDIINDGFNNLLLNNTEFANNLSCNAG